MGGKHLGILWLLTLGGTIILELNGSNEELGFCDVDVARINDVRSQLPSLANRQFLAE